MITQQTMEKYAELVVRSGVNIQKGQALMINAPIEGAEFTRIVARKAYELGAKDVHINWADDELSLLKYTHASEEELKHFPEWRKKLFDSFAEDGAASLSIHATDPDLLQDIDPARVAMATKAASEGMKKLRTYLMNDKIPWSVISIPTVAWARKIFPDSSAEEAVKNLWEAIAKIVRIDQDDPIAAWEEHNKILEQSRTKLNEKRYHKLIFTAPGTNLEIGLPEDHLWLGGAAVSQQGNKFNPNMPTEEVFTAPHKLKVNGTVASTMPLNYGGNIIDQFSLTFKDGVVVDYQAEKGADTLKHLLNADDGARRLGEVALVPNDSPVSKSGLIFYNTLFDENASCHLALGKAYPTNLKAGDTMSDEQLDQHGINDSLTHVDFMIGSEHLAIDGVKADGTKEAIFRNGLWA